MVRSGRLVEAQCPTGAGLMLYRLSANRASFKSIEFRKGLNIVLADRQLPIDDDEKTEQRRTRNGAGKSSLIDLVHFLLAGGRVH